MNTNKKSIFSKLSPKSGNAELNIWKEFAMLPCYSAGIDLGYKFVFAKLKNLLNLPCYYLYLSKENSKKLILENTSYADLQKWIDDHRVDEKSREILTEPDLSISVRDIHRQLTTVTEWGAELFNIPLILPGHELAGVIMAGPAGNIQLTAKQKKLLDVFSAAAASAVTNIKSAHQLDEKINVLKTRSEVSKRMLGSALEINRFVDLLLDLALTATKADAGFVAITDKTARKLSIRAHKNLPDDFINKINLSAKGGLFEWSPDDEEILILSDFGFVAEFNIKSILAVPLVERKKLVGVFSLISFAGADMFTDFSLSVMTSFVEQIKLVLNNSKLFDEFTNRYFQTLIAMSKAYDHRSPYTAGHSSRVSNIAAEIAYVMKLPVLQVKNIKNAGLIHDVGMCGVVDIGEDFQADYNHPEVGASMIEVLPISSDIIGGIKCHHEWFDGWGFPQGLKGDKIPLSGRILAVADYFADVTANNKFNQSMNWQKLVDEFQLRRGKQFDPTVVDALLSILNKRREIARINPIEFCWKFKGEPEDVCAKCPAYMREGRYCWSYPDVVCEKHGDKLCENCFIFKEWLDRIENIIKNNEIEVKKMEYALQQNNGITHLALTGEVDVSVAPKLRTVLKELIDAGRLKIIVDLGGVDFIDSSGLGLFVMAYKSVKAYNGNIKFAKARPEVSKVIHLTRLDKHFELFESVAQAESSF